MFVELNNGVYLVLGVCVDRIVLNGVKCYNV